MTALERLMERPCPDETCRACVYCVGGQFIPTTPSQCECDGGGCSAHAQCEHGNLLHDDDNPCQGCALEKAEMMGRDA